MKIFAPSYYENFRCIAGKCQHNCCIGWEIDIDTDTLDYYRSLNNDFGNEIMKNISIGDVPHFKLTENDRCPFLNQKGLCDIFSNLGEGALCQICSDHPRFKNYYDTRVEFGLGLCCEAAAEIILNNKRKFSLVVIDDDDSQEFDNQTEADLLFMRDSLFELLNKELSFSDKVTTIIEKYELVFKNIQTEYWRDIFLNLERLDNSWDVALYKLKNKESFLLEHNDVELSNILNYFIYRHFINISLEFDVSLALKFCILSCYIISGILDSKDELPNIARMYSSEIEYSDENIYEIIKAL